MADSILRFVRHSALTWMLLLGVLASSVSLAPERVDAQESAKPASKVQELLKERLATIREMSGLVVQRFKNNQGSFEEVRDANRMLLDAELALCQTNQDRVAVLEKFIVEAKNLEKITDRASKTGQGRASAALMAKADRLQAEIALERAQSKAIGSTGVDSKNQIALAEKQVDVKRAAVKVAEAQKLKAVAELASIKSQLVESQAAESLAEKQLVRFEELARLKSVEESLVEEGRLKLNAAKARRATVEGKIAESETQVLLEQARVERAQLEAEESGLRLKQLKSSTTPLP